MKTKVLYIVIGIIVTLGLATYFIPNNLLTNLEIPNTNDLDLNFNPKFNEAALRDIEPIQISVKNITLENINENTSRIQTIFDAHNPNAGTVVFETISYNIYFNNTRLVSGDIGEKPEGFVDSQSGIYPIIGNGTISLKDNKELKINGKLNKIWDKINEKNIFPLQVNGTYSYKQISSFQAVGNDLEFNLQFP